MSGISLRHKTRAPRSPSPHDTALYTYDMLMSLKRLAELNKQGQLASLIDRAAAEAQKMAERRKSEGK